MCWISPEWFLFLSPTSIWWELEHSVSSAGVHRGQGRVGIWAQVGRDPCPQRCSCIPPSAPSARISTPDSSTFHRREMISDYSDQCQKTVTRGYKATVHKIPVEIITLKVLPFQLFWPSIGADFFFFLKPFKSSVENTMVLKTGLQQHLEDFPPAWLHPK